MGIATNAGAHLDVRLIELQDDYFSRVSAELADGHEHRAAMLATEYLEVRDRIQRAAAGSYWAA